MSVLFPDTCPEAEKVLIELLRQAPPWRKLQMVGEMNETVKMLAMSGLRARYLYDSPVKLRRRLADILLGPELAEKVYDPLQEQDNAT